MKTVKISLEIIHETEESLYFYDGEMRAWVAKKLIPNYDPDWEPGPQTVEAEIPLWLAVKIGWI